jgi:hypothetical protein
VTLITLGLFSVASLLMPEGALTRAWLGLLRTVFGWGLLAVPLALEVLGLWLVLRKLQTRLPNVRPTQVVGSVVLYLGLLVLLHACLFPADRAESIQLAEQGRGGGMLGAVMLTGLLEALGLAGTVVIMGTWLVAGVMLLAGWSVADVVGYGERLLRRVRLIPAGRSAGESSAAATCGDDCGGEPCSRRTGPHACCGRRIPAGSDPRGRGCGARTGVAATGGCRDP